MIAHGGGLETGALGRHGGIHLVLAAWREDILIAVLVVDADDGVHDVRAALDDR